MQVEKQTEIQMAIEDVVTGGLAFRPNGIEGRFRFPYQVEGQDDAVTLQIHLGLLASLDRLNKGESIEAIQDDLEEFEDIFSEIRSASLDKRFLTPEQVISFLHAKEMERLDRLIILAEQSQMAQIIKRYVGS